MQKGRNMTCCGKLASGQLLMTFYKWVAAVAYWGGEPGSRASWWALGEAETAELCMAEREPCRWDVGVLGVLWLGTLGT